MKTRPSYTREFYSAINKHELVECEGNWMELENSILTQTTQAQVDKYHTSSSIHGS